MFCVNLTQNFGENWHIFEKSEKNCGRIILIFATQN